MTRQLAEAAQLYVASPNVHLWRGSQGGTAMAVYETPPVPLPPYVLFRVNVTQLGGSAGSKTTQCTFTYTATNFSAEDYGTGLAPEMARPLVGKMNPGTQGWGYYTPEGNFVLSWVDETPTKAGCP